MPMWQVMFKHSYFYVHTPQFCVIGFWWIYHAQTRYIPWNSALKFLAPNILLYKGLHFFRYEVIALCLTIGEKSLQNRAVNKCRRINYCILCELSKRHCWLSLPYSHKVIWSPVHFETNRWPLRFKTWKLVTTVYRVPEASYNNDIIILFCLWSKIPSKFSILHKVHTKYIMNKSQVAHQLTKKIK